MSIVIEARNLVKSYANKNVVDGIDLVINEGECFGILGPNGAGKTSTMRMMYCSSPVTSGELFVLGLNVKTNSRNIKMKIGVVPQEDGLDPDFSVLDNLLVYARYHNIPIKRARTQARELLRFMHLEEYDGRQVDTLSGGMRRRLTIARALLNDPQILFLDEPTTGLDPQARFWIWEAMADLKRRGKSLVLTTHYMEEAERICDRIILIDKGKILCEGRPADLINEYIGDEVVEFRLKQDEVDYYVKRIKEKFQYQIMNNRVRIFVKTAQEGRHALEQIESDNILVRKASLDDVFLRLAGYELRP